MANKPSPPPALNITIPPPPSGGKGRGQNAAFQNYLKAHGISQYAAVIEQEAGTYGVSKEEIAWAYVNTKGRVPNRYLGQTFGPTGDKITQQWASQPANAFALIAWSFSGGASPNPPASPQAAYQQYTGQRNAPTYPKNLTPTSVGRTPGQKVQGSVATRQAQLANTAYNEQRAKQVLDPIFLAYTGRTTPKNVLVKYAQNPISTYQLQQELSNPKNNPYFYKSPVWQTHAPDYQAAYKGIYGPNAVAPRTLIAKAVAQNLSQTAFEEQIRQLPNYQQSEEFKANQASFTRAYSQIYGTPDAKGQQAITMATKNGWNADQWNQYLRSQPEWMNSGEAQGLYADLANKLGLMPGIPPTPTASSTRAPVPTPSPTATGS